MLIAIFWSGFGVCSWRITDECLWPRWSVFIMFHVHTSSRNFMHADLPKCHSLLVTAVLQSRLHRMQCSACSIFASSQNMHGTHSEGCLGSCSSLHPQFLVCSGTIDLWDVAWSEGRRKNRMGRGRGCVEGDPNWWCLLAVWICWSHLIGCHREGGKCCGWLVSVGPGSPRIAPKFWHSTPSWLFAARTPCGWLHFCPWKAQEEPSELTWAFLQSLLWAHPSFSILLTAFLTEDRRKKPNFHQLSQCVNESSFHTHSPQKILGKLHSLLSLDGCQHMWHKASCVLLHAQILGQNPVHRATPNSSVSSHTLDRLCTTSCQCLHHFPNVGWSPASSGPAWALLVSKSCLSSFEPTIPHPYSTCSEAILGGNTPQHWNCVWHWLTQLLTEPNANSLQHTAREYHFFSHVDTPWLLCTRYLTRASLCSLCITAQIDPSNVNTMPSSHIWEMHRQRATAHWSLVLWRSSYLQINHTSCMCGALLSAVGSRTVHACLHFTLMSLFVPLEVDEQCFRGTFGEIICCMPAAFWWHNQPPWLGHFFPWCTTEKMWEQCFSNWCCCTWTGWIMLLSRTNSTKSLVAFPSRQIGTLCINFLGPSFYHSLIICVLWTCLESFTVLFFWSGMQECYTSLFVSWHTQSHMCQNVAHNWKHFQTINTGHMMSQSHKYICVCCWCFYCTSKHGTDHPLQNQRLYQQIPWGSVFIADSLKEFHDWKLVLVWFTSSILLFCG